MRILSERESDGKLVVTADEVRRTELWPEREGWSPFWINRNKDQAQFIYKREGNDDG